MFTMLLGIIYIAFISLGLPDALLGSAWPVMSGELHMPLSAAGLVSMIIAGGTIISSLNSDRLIRKMGTGKVTVFSVAMTAAALFGFSFSGSFWQLCLWAIPYGLGAGSVDAALNNFVALHYESRHMSWLHCFWGVGASLGPYIMGFCLTGNLGWSMGYRSVGILQVVLTAALFFSLPLWKKAGAIQEEAMQESRPLGAGGILKLPGAKAALLTFFCYCAVESVTGLWGSSYMVVDRGMDVNAAAKWTALFYLGITAGRFLSGFIAVRLGDQNMVRLGQSIGLVGILAILLPFGNLVLGCGFVLIGMGCAPIYPSLLHATPENFGKIYSQAIMGMQMACAYIGSTFMPPLTGLLVEHVSMKLYPFILLGLMVVMIFMAERLNRVPKKA